MKQALTEALARYDEGIDYVDPEGDVLVAAARLVERLLPGKCEHGETTEHGAFRPGVPGSSWMCSGQVWDEGIVAVVNKAIAVGLLDFAGAIDLNGKWSKEQNDLLARAVLSAIAQLAEKGAE